MGPIEKGPPVQIPEPDLLPSSSPLMRLIRMRADMHELVRDARQYAAGGDFDESGAEALLYMADLIATILRQDEERAKENGTRG